MSFKSIIQDMKGEFGRMRSRSHRVVEDRSVNVVDAMRQSCWANMPSELLRDVLARIEESDCSWPQRKNVVACGGVCRSWREIMKEIVRNLEDSGKLTFPISLKQPLTPDITPLFPSTGGGSELSPSHSSVPNITSSPSPPNPDSMAYGPSGLSRESSSFRLNDVQETLSASVVVSVFWMVLVGLVQFQGY